MTAKEKYITYCQQNEVALFQQSWWLETVCGKNWDAVFSENNGNIIGCWAFPYKKKKGFNLINMPMLTPGVSPIINYFQGQKNAAKISHEQQVMEDLIQQLPKYDLFDLYFLPHYKNHLSFYWKGFEQTTRYTYILHDLQNTDEIFSNFNSTTRTQIRKAEKEIFLSETEDIELFYQVNALSFKRQGKQIPYTLTYVKTIDTACKKHNCRKIILAKDAQNNIHAALYLVWDKQCAYYLMGGADENYKNSGAYSLLMWHAIKEAAKVSAQFNFCGSMLPSVERFFRSFGGEQTPYLHIKKMNSKALGLLMSLKK